MGNLSDRHAGAAEKQLWSAGGRVELGNKLMSTVTEHTDRDTNPVDQANVRQAFNLLTHWTELKTREAYANAGAKTDTASAPEWTQR